ncbi:MAG: hypothetical protein ACE5E2_05630 [Candidatus Binatia bacterium]
MKLQVFPIGDPTVLQQLVIQQIDLIEGQVQVIEVSIATEWGMIALGFDRERRLVVLHSDVIPDENLLPRLIGVYTWITRILPLVSRLYAQRGLDGSKVPRIVTIAPGFSETVQEGLAYLSFSVEPYTYQGVAISGERGIVLQSLRPQVQKTEAAAEPERSEVFLNTPHLTEAEVRFFEESPNGFLDSLPDSPQLSKF